MPNPYHDRLGRFTEGPSSGGGTKELAAQALRQYRAQDKPVTTTTATGPRVTPNLYDGARADIDKARIEQAKGEARKAKGLKGKPDGAEERTRAGMDVKRIQSNREALWDEIPEPVRAEGKRWYTDDGQNMLDIHKAAGSPLDGDPLADLKVRAVGSAFSPQVDWADAKTDSKNYFDAIGRPYQERVDAVVSGRKRMVYTDSIKRADRVVVAQTPEEIDLALRGSQPTTSHYYDNSQKIRHFYPNLNGNNDVLTCDTWDSRGARLHPDERRELINREIKARNAASKKPVPEDQLGLFGKGDRVPGRLVARADKLADAENAAAVSSGKRPPYMPSAPDMVQYGYDIIEQGTAAALPPGYSMAEYQAATWIWLRGSA